MQTNSRVWGIGLTRTGTTSLNVALNILGYQSVHWPTTAMLLLGDLQAATDESVAAVFKFLDMRYPGSRFILTERDEYSWLKSVRSHRARFEDRQEEMRCGAKPGNRRLWERTSEIVFTQTALYGTLMFDESLFKDGLRRHVEAVESHFRSRSDDLLRLRICEGAGWKSLCEFLGHPVPNVGFPHANLAAR